MQVPKHGDIIRFTVEPTEYRVYLQDPANIILECIESHNLLIQVGQLFEGYNLTDFEAWSRLDIIFYRAHECFDCRKIFDGDIHYLCPDCREKQGQSNHLTSAYGSARLAHIRSCCKSTVNEIRESN
jgi:hypothetical protein